MSLMNFELSTPKGDDYSVAYARLREFLEVEGVTAKNTKFFSSTRMYDVARVASSSLGRALAKLVSEGIVKLVVRVEPRLGEGIADFDSIEAVPDELPNWRGDGELIKVQPEHLRVYYKLEPNSH